MDGKPKINTISGFIRENSVLAGLFFAGTAVRLYMLGTRSFWFDESLVLLEAHKGIASVLGAGAEGIHPPLYRLIMHFWLYLGRSEWLLRVPSVVFSMTSVVFLYLIGRRLFDGRTARISVFLMSLSPFQVFYGQEVKMYSLFLLLSLASIYFFLRLLDKGRKADWFWYTGATVLNVYTHYFAFIILFAQNVFMGWYCFRERRGDTLKKWLVAHGAVLVLFLPWISSFFLHVKRVQTHFWIPPLSPAHFFAVFRNFATGYYDAIIPGFAAFLFLFIFIAGIAAAAARHPSPGKEGRIRLIFLLCFLILPPVTAGFFSLFFRNVYIDRSLIAVSAVYYLFLARGITVFDRHRLVAWGLLCSVGVLFLAGLKNYYADENFRPSIGVVRKKPVRELIGFVLSHYRAGDALVLGHCSIVYPFWYYCPPAMRERMYLAGNPAAYVNDAATLYGMNVTFGIEVSGSGKIDRSVRGVWLVQSGWEDVPVPLGEEWQRWFDEQQKVYETGVFKGMRLAYFRIASRDGEGGKIWERP